MNGYTGLLAKAAGFRFVGQGDWYSQHKNNTVFLKGLAKVEEKVMIAGETRGAFKFFRWTD